MAPRGPRTANERAVDAARRAATSFEDLPASYAAELYLQPIAVLLRYLFGSQSERRQEAAEAAYASLMENMRRWGRDLGRTPSEDPDDWLDELGDVLLEAANVHGQVLRTQRDVLEDLMAEARKRLPQKYSTRRNLELVAGQNDA